MRLYPSQGVFSGLCLKSACDEVRSFQKTSGRASGLLYGPPRELARGFKFVFENVAQDYLELPAPGHHSGIKQLIPELTFIFLGIYWGMDRFLWQRVFTQDLLGDMARDNSEKIL